MKVKEAADRLAALLKEIDEAGITIVTEDMGTIFLMRGTSAIKATEFAEISDMSGEWKVTA